MWPKRLAEKVFCLLNINIIIIVTLVTILRPQSRLKKIKNYFMGKNLTSLKVLFLL